VKLPPRPNPGDFAMAMQAMPEDHILRRAILCLQSDIEGMEVQLVALRASADLDAMTTPTTDDRRWAAEQAIKQAQAAHAFLDNCPECVSDKASTERYIAELRARAKRFTPEPLAPKHETQADPAPQNPNHIGFHILNEIIRQNMVQVGYPDPEQIHMFTWAAKAPEQLEAVVLQYFRKHSVRLSDFLTFEAQE
jgi:hypothetical protein